MPRPPLPADVEALLEKPNPAVVASIRPDGTPHTAATWYEWQSGRVLLSMDESRVRLRFMRANPLVSIAVFDVDDMYRSVTLEGRIVEFRDDDGLRDIDRVCRRYLGTAYPDRENRRVSALVEIANWFIWDSYRETQGLDDLGRRRQGNPRS